MNLKHTIALVAITLLSACQSTPQSVNTNTPVIEFNPATSTVTSQETPTATPVLTVTPSALPGVSPTPEPSMTSTKPVTSNVQGSRTITIDHSSLPLFDQIPGEYIDAASKIRLMIRGASVEWNIDNGLNCLWGNFPDRRPSSCFDAHNLKYNRSNWIYQSRGNPGWIDKVNDFVTQVDQQSNNFDAFTFAFGYVDGQDFSGYPLISDPNNFETLYIDKVETLEAAHPDKIFIWWTMSLARVGFGNTQNFNAMVRQYAIEHNKTLLDIADIESYDPEGNLQTNEQGYPVIYQGYTDEKQSGHLNKAGEERMAKAIWILMARVAGWDGKAQ